MKALVTGGAGFIGSNVVRLLLQRGDEVRVLDDWSSGHAENLATSSRLEVMRGDVSRPDDVAGAVEGVEVVFHLAASVGNARSLRDPVRDSEVNAMGTLHVLQACRQHDVPRVVYSSSAAIYGPLVRLPISEDHPAEPETPYGVSKLAGEKMCLSYGTTYGMKNACLRYFNVYGRNQRFDAYGNVIPIFLERLRTGKPLTIFDDGTQTRDFVNVADVANANLLAAKARRLPGAFNVASGVQTTVNELAKLMMAASGKAARVEHAPPRKGDVRDSVADISRARDRLGYEPKVRLAEGLKDYFAWAWPVAAR